MHLGHGAPPLVDDPLWVVQLEAWARALPRPAAILIVSAHWQNAPLAIGSTADAAPLTYDFYGFPDRYYHAVTRRRARQLWPAGSGRCWAGRSTLPTCQIGP